MNAQHCETLRNKIRIARVHAELCHETAREGFLDLATAVEKLVDDHMDGIIDSNDENCQSEMS